MDVYIPRPSLIPNVYDIATFKDGDTDHINAYEVKKTPRSLSCNCPGFYRQHDKTQHKHCLIIDFWLKNLEAQAGFALWFDGEDIEYKRFMNV